MSYPRILIDTNIIKDNVSELVNLAKSYGISLAGVTKGYCAHPEIVQAYVDGGISYLADSRIINLKKIAHFNIPKIMIRLPMISEAHDIIDYADISLNSELDTIKELSIAAIEKNKIHNIILMADLGDLREGYFNFDELLSVVGTVMELGGIKLIGIGSNLTCYGGVIPDNELLDKLIIIKEKISDLYNIELEIISGGNSSSVHLLKGEGIKGINNLRIGESIIFGTESAYGNQLNNTNSNAFKIQAEVIEIKEKPSVPTGKIGKDAFGKTPTFVDRGIRKRMLCAIGKQDIDLDTLYPLDKQLIILGGSSDHIILDCQDCNRNYKIGDIIEFNIHYVSLLRAMTSEYIEKVIIDK